MPLRGLAAALGRCAVAVGADTGPLRVAALVGTPTAMLFGPSSRGRYGPGAGHASRQARPGCPERRMDVTTQPSWYGGACPLETDPAGCILDIEPREVEATVAALLAGSGRPGRRGVLPDDPLGDPGEKPDGQAARMGIPGRSRIAERTPSSERSRPRLAATPRDRPDRGTGWPRDGAGARRIVVLRLDDIGDVVMSGPALRAIRLSRPHVRLHLLASPSGVQAAPLLPWIDRAAAEQALWQELGSPACDPVREAALIERLRAGRWDGAVILTSFGQSPRPAALACRRAGVPLVAGASDEAG